MQLTAMLLLVVGASRPQDAAPDLNRLSSALDRAVKQGDLDKSEEALKGLVKLNSSGAADAVCTSVGKVPANDPSLYWAIVDAIASFSGQESLKAVGEFLAKNAKKPFARDILYAFQNHHSLHMPDVLGDLLMKGAEDCEVLAAEILGEVPSKKCVEILIQKLEKLGNKPSFVKEKVIEAITNLTGKRLGEKPDAYREWWTVNKDKITEEDLARGPEGVKRESTGTAVDLVRGSPVERLRESKGTIVVLTSDCKHEAGVEDHDLDKMQDLLTKMSLPFIEVKKSEFEAFEMKGRIALLINCNQWRAHCRGKGCKASQEAGGLRLYKCAGTGPHMTGENKLSDKAIAKIREFVEKDGGYLFTEDWVLPEVLERAWPTHVRTGKYLTGGDVSVTPTPGVSTHPYLRRIFGRKEVKPDGSTGTKAASPGFDNVKHTWKIDDQSPSVRIVAADKIIKLMVSKEVAQQTAPADPRKKEAPPIILQCSSCQAQMQVAAVVPGQTVTHGGCGGIMTLFTPPKGPDVPPGGDDAVAISFFPGANPKTVIGTGGYESDVTKMVGGGRVVHTMSHFGKQKSQEDEFSLQNLLLNFLVEANERRHLKKKP